MHQINLNCGGFFMKKSMLVVLAGMLLALFSLSGKALADSDDPRTFVLSNELGTGNEGGLIDQLIAAGYGRKKDSSPGGDQTAINDEPSSQHRSQKDGSPE
jgi:hypothetical protein